MTALPDTLRVGPEYGVAVITAASPQAVALMVYILSPAGQATLAQHGFSPVGLPAP
jgi:molybdate transport system substrate-binding protein